MGLHVYTYRNELGDCTAGGESSYAKGFTVVNAKEPFEPCDKYPKMRVLVKQKFGFGCSLKLVPESKIDNNMTMFGGNYASTSDSRFGEKPVEKSWVKTLVMSTVLAVPIHDRVE